VDSIHLRALRMVPARPQDVLSLSEGHGIDVQGGHAEYMLMNADATYLIPDKISYEQAAPIFCAGYTVWSGLRWADPMPHERVAVLGIGGLGHLAVHF
jgi:alcohol dehydrogenase